MKKYLLVAFALGLFPFLAIGQGTVNFGSTDMAHRVLRDDGVTPPGPGFSAALYWAPVGSPESAMLQLGAITSVTGGTGFLVAGGTRTTGPGTPEGQDAMFQIRAWNGGFATFEEAVVNAPVGFLWGKTNPFMNPTGAPNATPPTPPAFLSGWTTPLIVSIPEPSTFALIGLGAGAWLLLRSQKRLRRQHSPK